MFASTPAGTSTRLHEYRIVRLVLNGGAPPLFLKKILLCAAAGTTRTVCAVLVVFLSTKYGCLLQHRQVLYVLVRLVLNVGAPGSQIGYGSFVLFVDGESPDT